MLLGSKSMHISCEGVQSQGTVIVGANGLSRKRGMGRLEAREGHDRWLGRWREDWRRAMDFRRGRRNHKIREIAEKKPCKMAVMATIIARDQGDRRERE